MNAFRKSQSGVSYFLFILIAIIAVGSGILIQSSKPPPAELPEFKKTILLPTPKALGEVNFTDHNGQQFGLSQLQGQWSILFFGFTNCPDICPTTMQTLKQVKHDVAHAGAWHNFRVVMVSVDPERDTTERLKSYVPFFDPKFIGIRASVEHTTAFAKNLGILFFKSKQQASGAYDVDHGAAIILINPEGQYAGVMTAPHIQTDISADLIKLAAYAGVTGTPSKAQINPTNAQNVATKEPTDRATLTLQKAWIRPAPPNAPSMAAYFDFVNNSARDITIVDSSSTYFAHTMLHDTVFNNGIASMEHLDRVTIPAGAKVTLAPAAKHMMLMGANADLTEGDIVDLTFISEDGSQYPFNITVQQQPQ